MPDHFSQPRDIPPSSRGGPTRPHVHVIATGGTIAGTDAATDGLGYRAGALPLSALLQNLPRLQDAADISSEQFCNIGSQDMDEAIWLGLAQRVRVLLADSTIDGVVITHGTDTLEETAYFLALTIASPKPVVLVGAMRPATAPDADGPDNLADAITVAASASARDYGVVVVMNRGIYSAHTVEKRHTRNVDAITARDGAPIGRVHHRQVTFSAPPTERAESPCVFSLDAGIALPRVDIIYAYAGLGRTLIDAAVTSGCAGIVLAGVGCGNAGSSTLAGLQDAVLRGVVVVRSSRVGAGTVERNQEVADDRLGFVAAAGLSPQKARILLMLALTQTHDARALQQLFLLRTARTQG
jgi:L-asparaginase